MPGNQTCCNKRSKESYMEIRRVQQKAAFAKGEKQPLLSLLFLRHVVTQPIWEEEK